MGTLTAPVAVRVLDLDTPLDDLDLSYPNLPQDYRSLLAVVRLAENPVGVATFPVEPDGCLTGAQLRRGVYRQLGHELSEAFARRGHAQRDGPASATPQSAGATRPSPLRSVSVVVPTCSNPVKLERCLRSILRCGYDDFEVIVVENRPGSLATARMIVSQFGAEERLRYVEEPRPSASRARNAGLARAEGEIVAFADDDIVVDPGWLFASVEALVSAPDIACVTGLILPMELESETQLLLEQFAGFGKGFRRKVYRLPEARDENPLLPYAAGALGSGASIVMLTEVARELGGFDPALGPATPSAGGEDLDLLARTLGAGYAVAYEPRAMVWHEHPGGSKRRLRRQVYHYGVGLGAMLSKQLLAGPDRREFLGSVPAGLRYLRDPGSRKNAGKPSGYPRPLTWIERLGMLMGPFAYVLSVLIGWARKLSFQTTPSARALRIVRQMVVDTEPVKVVWFKETEGRAVRFAWRRHPVQAASGPSIALVFAAAAVCLLAPLLVVFGAPAPLRLPAVLALLGLVPGTAWLTAARARSEPGLVIGISLGVAGVTAQSMLWLGAWWPRAFLSLLAIVCLVPLGRRLAGAADLRRELTASARHAYLRMSQVARDRPAGMHIALLVGALLAWAISLTGARLSQISGIGLLSAMPPAYYLAFALLLGGFAVAVTSEEPRPWLLGAYVLGAIVVIHATTAFLYDEPRYAWVYKHLGVINLISATGRANRQVDIYNNWPSFFALNAWFSRSSGVAPIAYAGWAQLFFNTANAFVLRFAFRGLVRDERLVWTAVLIFVLGNWVGQDYLAPQAYGFTLSLVVLGLCLRCGRAIVDPRSRQNRWPASALWRGVGRLLPEPVPDELRDAAPVSRWTALAIGGVCFLAVVTSHQLSPVILVGSVLLLALITRCVPLWIPAVMALVEAWWIALAMPFVAAHFQLIDVGGAGTAAPGRDLNTALAGAKLSFYAPAAVMALIAVLALIGFGRRLAQGKLDLAPACLIVAPVAIAAFQSYGGEGPYRAYLFALPWLAFLAVFACTNRNSAPGRPPIALGRLLAAMTAVGACLLFAYFGQEVANRVTPNDVRASLWYERHAPAGSMRIELSPNAPERLTARYPLISLSDPPSLVTNPSFTGHRLGTRDVPRLVRLIEQQRARPAYVVLSRLQENYARLNGLLPRGSLTSFVAALGHSRAFRLVYRLPTVWIFEYVPPHPLGAGLSGVRQ